MIQFQYLKKFFFTVTTLNVQSTSQINTVETNLNEPLARIHPLALKPLLIAALAVSMGTPTENIIIRVDKIFLLH